MQKPDLSPREWLKAVAGGVVVALLISAVMVPVFKAGLSPLPKPLGLAFAETVLGGPLPLPVGLLAHVLYVTAWTVAAVAVCRGAPPFVRALALGLALWVLVLILFFPVVGWGFLGLAVGPQLIVAALVPHLLFAVLLWAAGRLLFAGRGG